MLEEIRLKHLNDFLNNYSNEELIWINGYLSGLVSEKRKLSSQNGHTNGSVQAVSTNKITLVFGTETGNAKRVATQLATAAKKNGFIVKFQGLDQYRLTDLSKEEYFFVVISTQGEGEPPIGAKQFYDHIHANNLSLSNLKFSVLALGDTSYPMYCKTGEDVDTRLEQLGGKRIVPMQKCDVEFSDEPQTWLDQIAAKLKTSHVAAPAPEQTANVSAAKKPTGKKIYNGKIITNINLNDRGSNKQTFHIELETEEPIIYEPGDTIGIVPKNRKDVVDKILAITGIDPKLEIATAKATATVAELLINNLSICYLLSSTIKKYAAITQQEIPDVRMDLIDLLKIYPVKEASQFAEIVKVLMSIAPRLYSVSSSPAAHGETEVHITVVKDNFLALDEQRFGLCSDFLGDLPIGTTIQFYVHKDKNFKLPAPDKDIILITPGTGIAASRSFLAERDATAANGRNWLFFGEQHFVSDFLYQTEIQNYVQTGVLTKIDLAFSRDQQEKIYVQHRMLKQSKELFQWIENGASVFVSGTKDPMSKDVEKTLLHIFEEEGKKTNEEALQYLKQLEKEGRYEKDVY